MWRCGVVGTEWWTACCALAGLVLAPACATDDPKDTSTIDVSCSPYPAPEDAPMENELSIGGRGYICYKPAPEGICVAVTGAESAAVVAEQGASAAGCEEGVVVIDGLCPVDLRLGDCLMDETGETWSVYPCNRWADLPGGEAAGCEGMGGAWTPAL